MKKPLALFDIDGTMIPGTTYFRVLDGQMKDGLIDESCVAEAYSLLKEYKSGAVPYEKLIVSLLDIYAKGLAGKTAQEVASSTINILTECEDYFGYVGATIAALRDTHEIIVVSGSPHFMAEAVMRKYGIGKKLSSVYEVQDGIITGKVSSYLATRHQKRDAIQHIIEDHQYTNSVAFGDSEGDIEVLKSVQYPVCIMPTDGLRQIAKEKKWVVIDSDLDLHTNAPLRVVMNVTT